MTTDENFPHIVRERRRELLQSLLAIHRADFNPSEWQMITKRVAELGCDGNDLPHYSNRNP